MKSIKVSSNKLPERVTCPTSKSYANRALILASLVNWPVRLRGLADCDDTKHMISGLQSLGVEIEGDLNSLLVKGCALDTHLSPVDPIDLGEGGTTIRFFMALAAVMNVPVTLKVHPDFLKRPITEYLELLGSLGAKAQVEGNHINIKGPIRKGVVEVDCSKTTQFASALELVSKAAGIQVHPVNIKASKAYLEMTKRVVDKLEGQTDYTVPVDYSSLGYFAAYAALTGDVFVFNAGESDPYQADSKILRVLEEMGGSYLFQNGGLLVKKVESFNSVEVDGSDCLDLVPTLIFLMSYSGKKQVLKNIANLRFKECDRLAEMMRMMGVFGISYEYDESSDRLVINGTRPDGVLRDVEVARDHRMVMVATLFLKLNGGGSVGPSEAVAKSFATFFNYFQ